MMAEIREESPILFNQPRIAVVLSLQNYKKNLTLRCLAIKNPTVVISVCLRGGECCDCRLFSRRGCILEIGDTGACALKRRGDGRGSLSRPRGHHCRHHLPNRGRSHRHRSSRGKPPGLDHRAWWGVRVLCGGLRIRICVSSPADRIDSAE